MTALGFDYVPNSYERYIMYELFVNSGMTSSDDDIPMLTHVNLCNVSYTHKTNFLHKHKHESA